MHRPTLIKCSPPPRNDKIVLTPLTDSSLLGRLHNNQYSGIKPSGLFLFLFYICDIIYNFRHKKVDETILYYRSEGCEIIMIMIIIVIIRYVNNTLVLKYLKDMGTLKYIGTNEICKLFILKTNHSFKLCLTN